MTSVKMERLQVNRQNSTMECLLESQDHHRAQVCLPRLRYCCRDLGFKRMDILNQEDLLTNLIFMRLLLIILLLIKVPQSMIVKSCA